MTTDERERLDNLDKYSHTMPYASTFDWLVALARRESERADRAESACKIWAQTFWTIAGLRNRFKAKARGRADTIRRLVAELDRREAVIRRLREKHRPGIHCTNPKCQCNTYDADTERLVRGDS